MLILFHASAGSGKTYQLALSYLKLLKEVFFREPEAIREILATTFTNKAVFEMKERIINFLKEIALRTEKGKILAKETQIGAEEAENLLEKIFCHYDYIKIKTIDSFLLKLFRGLAYELNLPPYLQIKTYLETSHLEKALIELFKKALEKREIQDILENYVKSLLSAEDTITLNIKAKLIRELDTFVKVSTYREDLIYLNLNDIKPSEEDLASQMGFYCYKLWTHLKEALEIVLMEAGDIYLGIWKEKLANQITKDFLPWIYLKLGNVKAFIIDEFQDTDKLQWLVLKPIIDDLISQGRSFIIAGDTKQCLYRWKGSDPTLIRDIENKLKPYGLNKNYLKKNFRSCINLITFNNLFFTILKDNMELKRELIKELVFGKTPKEDIPEDLLERAIEEFDYLFSEISQDEVKALEGRVYLHLPSSDTKEKIRNGKEEKIKLYQKIESILTELKEKGQLENTAILLRENKDINELATYLISRGFSVIGSSLLKLKESLLINILMAYLKLLVHPKDELAITTILLGMDREKGREILSKYQILRRQKRADYLLSDYLKSYYEDFWNTYIDAPLQKASFLNIYQFFRYLINNFQLEDKFPEERLYLYKFLSFILNETSKGLDLWSILLNWEKVSEEEGLELPQEKEAIQILTIHLSKGLEFKNVILPLNFSVKGYRAPLSLFITEQGIFKGRLEYLPPFIKEAYYEEKILHALEFFNLIYVAFTRAIQNLYILGMPNTFATKFFEKIYSKIKDCPDFKDYNFLIEYNFSTENPLVPDS
ncbi:MAG: UvrD-helicase domain-containing protein [Caldimicrobium sp.]